MTPGRIGGALLLLGALLPIAAAPAHAEDTLDVVLERLRASDTAMRAEAAETLGRGVSAEGRSRAVGALVVALADPSPTVRHAAANALRLLDDPAAAHGILARVGIERDDRVLCSLLLAAGAVADAAAAPRLATVATEHPSAPVRASAVTALADLGGEIARRVARGTVLRPGLPDPDWSLRAAALLALARCGHADDVGPVLVAYREGGGEAHWFARSALARLVAKRDRDPLPLLRSLVLDADPRVAVTAAAGIVALGHAEETARLFHHAAPAVRVAAVGGVVRARAEGEYARVRRLARFDVSRRVRWAAALALFEVEDSLGEELVLLALGASEPSVWAEAVAVLAARTGEHHGRSLDGWRGALARWRERR